MQFDKEYEVMISALKIAKDAIDALDKSELQPLKARVSSGLAKEINSLSVLMGKGGVGELEAVRKAERKPLKSFMGKRLPGFKLEGGGNGVATASVAATGIAPIIHNEITQKEFREIIKQTAEDAELEEFRRRVEDLYSNFRSIDSDQILDKYSDQEIKGVAKQAGIPVSDNAPKKIDTRFILQVKEAIRIRDSFKENDDETGTASETA